MVEAAGKTFGLADCKQHTTEKDCWLIISGKVYNVTDFLDEHPGGFDIIISATGKGALVLQAVFGCFGCSSAQHGCTSNQNPVTAEFYVNAPLDGQAGCPAC